MSKVALNSVCKIIGGYAFKSGLMSSTPGKYQVIKMSSLYKGGFDLSRNPSFLNDIDDRQKSFLLKDGDILITLTGTVGKRDYGYSVLIKEPNNLLLNQRVCLIRPDQSKMDSRFLLSALQSRDFLELFYASSIGGTGNQTNVSIVDLGELEIKLPETLLEQKKIADFIEQWNTAIEKTEALIEAKERQFGWLKSKLLLRNPNAKHWKTETLGHYIEEKKDKSTVPDLHPCLTSSRRGMFLQDEYFSKQVASKDNTGYKIMSRGDFTYRSMSDDGTFVFNKQDIVDKGLISPAYGVFASNKYMDAHFLYYFLNSSAFKRALAGEVQGGTRTALKLNALKKLDVDIPELPEQKAIANKLNTAKHEIDLLIKLADQYRTQKRGLMQKLLSGEWHIKNKEAA